MSILLLFVGALIAGYVITCILNAPLGGKEHNLVSMLVFGIVTFYAFKGTVLFLQDGIIAFVIFLGIMTLSAGYLTFASFRNLFFR